MEVIITAQGGNSSQLRQNVTTVVSLSRGDVYRLPDHCTDFYVVAGIAWLTDATGQDKIVWAGEAAHFLSSRPATLLKPASPALVSALGDVPLVVEFPGSAL